MKITVYSLITISFLLISGCESANFIKSELTGTSKPEGGIKENIPISKTYNVTAQSLRSTALEVLDEQGYIYEENTSTGTIKTEPKLITDTSKFAFYGAYYSAKLIIKLEGNKISYRAKFNKKSNLTMEEQNIEFPEKENEMRKAFFDALANKLGVATFDKPGNESDAVNIKSPNRLVTTINKTLAVETIIQAQNRLLELGYDIGEADGVYGNKTKIAVKKYQQKNGLTVTGNLDNETLVLLGIAR